MSILTFGQGVTTSSMLGTVTDQNGEALIGVNVIATHTPSGTTYGTVTDLNGRYKFNNMRVGGPYNISMTYVGFSENKLPNQYLSLGEERKYDVILQEGGVLLEELVITGSTQPIGTSTGTSTNISNAQIENMPTLGRNLSDYTRLTPTSRSTFGGGTSLGGQNNRYNAVYIDGAVNNDVFGLAPNGQNGGQVGIAPFSIDAIDQIQVVLSPYDVSYGGFAGGGINAVTKSGTNQLQGTAYFFSQGENLAGKTNRTILDRIEETEGDKLDEFTNNLVGLSLGGPIVKDKVFFFANAEIQNEETPSPFAGDYDGDSSLEDVESLGDFLMSEYGYDAGEFGNKISRLDGTRLFGKLDFNLSVDHKLTLRHNYTRGESRDVNGSSRSRINFANNGVFFPSITNSSALELNSNFGTNKANSLIIGYTRVRDDRDPIGQDFPNVRIDDGQGSIRFGSEAFSTANALDQNILTITDNFKIYKGDHTLTIGTHNEFISFYNLFIRQNYGAYTFASLEDFYAGNVDDFDRSYSLVDDLTGDGSAAAAEFSAAQLGFYVQDEWSVSNKMTVTSGLRLDVPILGTDPSIDPSFNSTTLPLLEAAYDLQGAQGGQAPKTQLLFSPRIGVNFDANSTTTIRGGIGVFTSRVPFVWPGGMYTNNGITVGGLNENDIDATFIADPLGQPTNPNATIPSGQIDLFSSDFKYPQVLRASLGLDKEIGDGWMGSIEGMYTKTLNNVFYQNVNSDPTVDFNWTNGADDRPIFTGDRLDGTYTAVYLASNTNEGYAYNVTASLNKSFDSGFSLYGAYSIGDSEAIFEGTSSQNSSQWRGAFTTDGRNNAELARSDFALGNRIIGSLGQTIRWNDEIETNISLFYQGQSGDLFSYVYDRSNINNEAGSTSRQRHLIYIPADQSDIMLVDDGDVTAAQQWEMLNTYIEEDEYLSSRRGEYAEKNSNRTPFTHQFDLRIAQDLGIKIGPTSNRLQVSLDIFNVGNLINSNWGAVYGNPFDYRLINFEGYDDDGTTPTFTFSEEDLGDDRFSIVDRASRWRGRIGIRYIFN